jgi:hypothetical protein
MMVQSFGTKASLREDFNAFCHALDAQKLPGGMAVVPSFSQPRLFLGWSNGDARFLDVDLPSLIKQPSILNTPLAG